MTGKDDDFFDRSEHEKNFSKVDKKLRVDERRRGKMAVLRGHHDKKIGNREKNGGF